MRGWYGNFNPTPFSCVSPSMKQLNWVCRKFTDLQPGGFSNCQLAITPFSMKNSLPINITSIFLPSLNLEQKKIYSEGARVFQTQSPAAALQTRQRHIFCSWSESVSFFPLILFFSAQQKKLKYVKFTIPCEDNSPSTTTMVYASN